MTRRLPLAAALLAATALAACSGGSDAPDTPVNNGDNQVEVIDETPQNIATPEPTPTPSPTPAPIVQDDRATDEQVQDDADAVGMTARLPRDQSGNETAPVE
jgi:PBP1b-binding outer membrane lipoprotein LpoB